MNPSFNFMNLKLNFGDFFFLNLTFVRVFFLFLFLRLLYCALGLFGTMFMCLSKQLQLHTDFSIGHVLTPMPSRTYLWQFFVCACTMLLLFYLDSCALIHELVILWNCIISCTMLIVMCCMQANDFYARK